MPPTERKPPETAGEWHTAEASRARGRVRLATCLENWPNWNIHHSGSPLAPVIRSGLGDVAIDLGNRFAIRDDQEDLVCILI